jgi:hypothetical protein
MKNSLFFSFFLQLRFKQKSITLSWILYLTVRPNVGKILDFFLFWLSSYLDVIINTNDYIFSKCNTYCGCAQIVSVSPSFFYSGRKGGKSAH